MCGGRCGGGIGSGGIFCGMCLGLGGMFGGFVFGGRCEGGWNGG